MGCSIAKTANNRGYGETNPRGRKDDDYDWSDSVGCQIQAPRL